MPDALADREAILAAGAKLFDEVGFHNATMGSIAERAGMGKADVYAMFRAKHDILYAIHDEWIDELLAAGRVTIRSDCAVRDVIRQCFHDIFAVIHAKPSGVRAYFENFRDLPPDLQRLAKAKRDIYEAQVEGLLRRGMDDGVLRPQNARVAAMGLFGMCNWAYRWYRPGGAMSHQQIATQLGEIYLAGIAA